jgi:hypothetical protein
MSSIPQDLVTLLREVRHRDSEKAPGMFATAVVMFPSDYSGGELLVHHKGREMRLDLRRNEPSEVAFAAFYADCLHEVPPVLGRMSALEIGGLSSGVARPLGVPAIGPGAGLLRGIYPAI